MKVQCVDAGSEVCASQLATWNEKQANKQRNKTKTNLTTTKTHEDTVRMSSCICLSEKGKMRDGRSVGVELGIKEREVWLKTAPGSFSVLIMAVIT